SYGTNVPTVDVTRTDKITKRSYVSVPRGATANCLRRDCQPATFPRARRGTDDDLHVLPERVEEVDQPLRRNAAQADVEQMRHRRRPRPSRARSPSSSDARVLNRGHCP